MKQKNMMNRLISNKWRVPSYSVLVSSLVLSACGGGGGASAPLEPEAVVMSVANASVLEGSIGTAPPNQLKFLVTLNKNSVRGLDVSYNTASTAKTGFASTGSAIGAASCAVAGTHYVNTPTKVTIAAGSNTGYLLVDVCPDNVFAPNQTLKLVWSSVGSSGGSAIGTIINDDAGGLNGTGAATVMGGAASFGRDTQSLTNADADGAKGFSFAKRQSDTAWNCTYDNVTGLNWLRPWTSGKTYSDVATAVSAANSASSCGSTDWRAPTVNELLSLMDISKTASYGAVNADREGVVDVPMSNKFWSSEVLKGAPTINAWIVDSLNGGAVTFAAQTAALGVRLVSGQALTAGNSRATACADDTRYKSFTDQTVEDIKTGLMWKQCREGASGDTCSVAPSTTLDTESAIVNYVNTVNANPATTGLGYSDWRIPTVKELSSLVDRCSTSPAINKTVFPNNSSISFVTGSLDANNGAQFWYVDFSEGTIAVAPPTGKYLRLVRAGQ